MKIIQWVAIILAWLFLVASFVQTNVILSVWSAVVALFFLFLWLGLHAIDALGRLAAPAKAQGLQS